MENLTQTHRIAYKEAVETIKRTKEYQRTLKQRLWIIGIWGIVFLGQLAWKYIQHPEINVTVIMIMSLLVAIILLAITPFGSAKEINAGDIEHELVRWIGNQTDSLRQLRKVRSQKEEAAQLDSENWSTYLQDLRNEWNTFQPKVDKKISNVQESIIKLNDALQWARSLNES